MLGAICGDIVGSRFEFSNYRKKDFELFSPECRFTDDTVLTAALASTLLLYPVIADEDAFKADLASNYRSYALTYPSGGYGGRFLHWILAGDLQPYNSCGNGSAMRVSPAGWYARTLEEAEHVGELSAVVTHNHPEGIRGAKATAAAVWLARSGYSKGDIKRHMSSYYPQAEKLSVRRLMQVRDPWDETCQGTMPVALCCFYESENFEDAIRNSIAVGGDSDTIGAICGGIAGAFYTVPGQIADTTLGYLDDSLRKTVTDFIQKYCC